MSTSGAGVTPGGPPTLPGAEPRYAGGSLALGSFARPRPVGLLAGGGRFPVIFALKAQQLGLRVVCVAIRGMAVPELQTLAHRCYWTPVGQLGRMIRSFQRECVADWVMAGKVHKNQVLRGRWRRWRNLPDWRMLRIFWSRLRDQRDDSILSSIVAEFEAEGLHCRSALEICPELLVRAGVLTRRQPSAAELRDVDFGWNLAKEMGRLDIGQSVIVREGAVLAVEAIEGTDRAIMRAGELCARGRFTVVKVAKPQQDMRFDVPTIGVTTIETMHRAGGRVLAVEAGKTIILDEADTVAHADRYGISILAR